jgi:hypothetical protein
LSACLAEGERYSRAKLVDPVAEALLESRLVQIFA